MLVKKFITPTVMDDELSVLNMGTNVVKVMGVVCILKDVVPRTSLHGSMRKHNFLKFFNCAWFLDLEAIIILHVFFFSYNLLGLREINRFKKVGKVFIDYNLFSLHAISHQLYGICIDLL